MADLIAELTTPMILTYNEGPNLRRCLEKLRWAQSTLIVDSGSTDETLEIARCYPRVNVIHRAFDNFANQCNFGLSHISTPWVLSLDADYELTEPLVAELLVLREGDAAGYSADFIYRIYGRPLRASLYPPRVVLYRREGALYRNEGHGHRVTIGGRLRHLGGRIYHDDRKPLSRWLASQQRYAGDEVVYLLSSPRSALGRTDRLRLMGWPAPVLAFFYTLLWKGCLLDGWPGWFYALQRTAAETMIALEIVDRRLRAGCA